jgi:hypothetical protein
MRVGDAVKAGTPVQIDLLSKWSRAPH